jgi:hypothetical protein
MNKLAHAGLSLLLPLLAFGQEAKTEAPRKETISSYRVFAKDGEESALKAALGAHARKYHTGNWKMHVSQVLSGPDEGSYMIVEGPNSWTDFETRADITADHEKDYQTNIAPHVEKSTPEIYATLEPDASTVAGGAFSSTKTLIRHYYVKPGRGPRLLESLKLTKRIWEKRGQNVVVWSTFFSGEPDYILVFRLKNGWKDLDEAQVDMRKAADESIGPGAYERILDEISLDTSRVIDEMTEQKPDLSSN